MNEMLLRDLSCTRMSVIKFQGGTRFPQKKKKSPFTSSQRCPHIEMRVDYFARCALGKSRICAWKQFT